MSTEAVSLVLACLPYGGGMGMLAVALADAAAPDGTSIFKSVATLATHSKQSERTVQRSLTELIDSGWLIADTERSGGKGRATVYRISHEWMSAAHAEMANARAGRRQPMPVDPATLLRPKGDKLTPFDEGQRVTNRDPKGDKKRPKGDKNALKGDIAVSPEHELEQIHEQYPPTPHGGAPVDKSESESESGSENQNLKALLAELIALHPRHDPSDTRAASRALAALAAKAPVPSAKRAGEEDAHAALRSLGERLRQRLASDARFERWQSDGHRYAPRLSRWLRGMAALSDLPASEAPAAAPDEAERTRQMLAQSQGAGAPPPPEIAARIAAMLGRKTEGVSA